MKRNLICKKKKKHSEHLVEIPERKVTKNWKQTGINGSNYLSSDFMKRLLQFSKGLY